MLDIVITHYQEPWSVCRRLFETLDAQRGVDWDQIYVTVVNDGGDRLPEDMLEDLNFRCVQLDIPHGGISAARNAGLDHAEEPWIMFCDCDDCFSNVFALEDILNVLPGAEKQYDMMWTKVWSERLRDGAHQVYQIHDKKIMVFIHGKVYRREFLLDEGIRFDESMTFNEDSLFNATIMTRTTNARIGEISTYAPAYVWIVREGSVTDAPDADDKSAIGQLRRNMKVTDQYRVHRPEGYAGMVTRVIYDTYFMTHTGKYSPSCKQQVLDEFRRWIKTQAYGDFTNVDAKHLRQIREISRAELTRTGEDIPDDPGSVVMWLLGVVQT